jgi:PAS domain S-box-containing protein
MDATERKLSENALRESEEKFRLTFSSSPDAVNINRLEDGLYVEINDGFTRATGFTREDIIGRTSLELNIWHDPADRQKLVQGLQKKGYYENLEAQFRRKDGSLITGLMSARIISLKGVPHIISIVRDITERKKTEEAIAKERTFSENIINSLPGIFYMFDDLGKLVRWNSQFEEVTGYLPEELFGMQPTEFFSEEHKNYIALRVLSVFSDGEAFAEAPFLTKEGDRIPYFFTGRLTVIDGKQHLLGVGVDITERIRVEEEKNALQAKLQNAQKFEAIGTLAGGIAHDFNNLLMGIQGRASLLSFDLESSHPHLEHIHAIEEYIRSATSLTKQLLGLARGGKYEVDPVDMNELVHGSSAMFGRTKKEIRIHAKCHASPLVVEADRGQIEQVLLNMYINAWQAMPPDGGHLYLETRIVTLDEVNCNPHQVAPGRYVKVSITDTGTGMDEATRLRIFDPFFTTKEMGRGTGLGLASAYGIIKNHGGMITVYSEVGHGTTFNIYLPISEKESQREVPIERGLIKGSATILLVDDEELIIDVGQAMIERLGYRVMVCRGGQEAVKAITDKGNEIDLVILDMIMPGMDGGTTFDRIREIQPDIPVILSSGYAINGHADSIMRRGCNGFIQKPYNISELSQKIGKVLDKVKGC